MGAPRSHKLSVLVVDDSAVARQVLSAVLTAAGMEVRVAPDPVFALQKLRHWEPDVVVLDLEMPRMDGLTFLARLRTERDTPVVVCSGTTEGRGTKALQALEQGAVEVVTKPRTAVREFLFESSVMLVDAVTAAAATRPAARARHAWGETPSLVPTTTHALSRRDLIAIGASTGGPEAIRAVLSGLPKNAPPVVVVQHMPAGFTRDFAKRLNEQCLIDVREAASGDTLRPGLALIAAGGRHLLVRRKLGRIWVEVATGPLVSRHRPSVDLLFESVAEQIGTGAVAVLLTGMGDDGALGLCKLKDAGAATIAQDEASSVVYGMPKAAVDRGAALEIVALGDMSRAILRHC